MSLDLRGHATGEIITPEWGNYVDQSLMLSDVRMTELALELALQGLAPDFISLYYDLFNDTSMSDAGVLTANLDVGNEYLHLPGGWTQDVSYLYQTVEKTLDFSASAAHMILRHNGSAHATITPKLSVIASGSHSFVAGTLIDSRAASSTIGIRTDNFDNLAYTDEVSTTALVDTSIGAVRLQGGANDPYTTPERETNNAVADVISSYVTETDYYSKGSGVSVAWHPTDGSCAIAYSSKEYNATYANVRIRVRLADGSFKTWGGQSYIDVTTSAAAHQTNPKLVWNQGGTTLGVMWLASTDAKYVLVNAVAGSVGTAFTVLAAGTGTARWDMVREVDGDYIRVLAKAGGAVTVIKFFRFAMTDAAPGSATDQSTNDATGSPLSMTIDIDQDNDLHVVLMYSGTLRYNVWDTSAAGWTYTWRTGDVVITAAHTVARVKNTVVVADRTQAPESKLAWVLYARDNASTKSAVYMKTITAGSASGEYTIKTSASLNYHGLAAAHDVNNSVLQVLYCEASAGLLTNTVDTGGTLGTEATVDVNATDAGTAITVKDDYTEALVGYRTGADNNSASELWVSTRNLGYTLLSKLFLASVYTLSQQATKFLLSPTQTVPTNTTLTYLVSADNGSHWETATPGVVGTFTYPGTQVILKATLQTTDVDATPLLEAYSLKALLATTEDVYEWVDLAGTKVKAQLNIESDDAVTDTIVYDWGLILA